MRVIASTIAAALVSASLSGCGGLSTTCGDFNEAASDKQMELANGWLENNADAADNSILFRTKSDSEKTQYIVDTLTEYCADNPDKDLSSLTPGFAFGT